MFGFKPRRIYLDYASATPVSLASADAMQKAMGIFANPGSIHADGVAAKKLLEQSRETIAHDLACKSREIVFVSGGTEANNLAIVGHARKLESIRRTLAGTHWIVSAIEHPSVLECFSEVERLGGEVAQVQPDHNGLITEAALEHVLRPETIFVSIGWANHEIGVVQPLSVLSRVIRAHEEKNNSRIIFHTDAGQAPLYRAPQVHTLGVDLMSLDSGKLYGPRGIGAIYISNRTELSAIIFGGKQERALRAGTENVSLAAGFARAMMEIASERAQESRRLLKLRETFVREISQSIPDAVFNGDLERSLPHIVNISIPDIESEYITLTLDAEGISIATKSACREGEESLSHVVSSLGGETWRAANTLRISVGRATTARELSRCVSVLADAVQLFRKRKMI